MIITIRTTLMTMATNDNTTNTGDHEWQMVGFKIHHISSPWHDCHITTSLLDMSSPLPSPSPHTLAFMSEQLSPIFESISSTSQHQQQLSTVRLPRLTIYLTHLHTNIPSDEKGSTRHSRRISSLGFFFLLFLRY